MTEFLQQLINGVAWGSIYALIALGYTMVYGVLRLINFAHGDVYMVGAMAGFYLTRWLGWGREADSLHFILILMASMLICGLLGFLIERAAYRPLRNRSKLTALITAIGVSLLLENGGQFGADPKFFPTLIENKPIFQSGGLIITNIQFIIIVVSLVLMAALQYIIFQTRIGRAMRAVSFSHDASRLMGIDIDAVISWTFIVGSMLAAAAGILVGLSNPKIEPLMGLLPGLKAFVAAVLGGVGNIPGAVLGALILGISETMVSGYISSTYRDAIAFVLLVVILLFKPAGLLGKAVPEKV
ncbi:MAG: branched-chain amino acid ABC transporter permease [bacterium]|nr:MAG: branched-chain amino acid ABC transporter permease [bacterium]